MQNGSWADMVPLFDSSLPLRCSNFGLARIPPKRKKAVDRLHQAFQSGRTLGLTPILLDHAGQIFRALYGNASGLTDRLGPMNDVLIALTAREIGATVVTSNVLEFRRIATKVPSLKVTTP